MIFVFLKYLISDLPLIITSFVCMWVVLKIWMPKRTVRRRWLTLILIESFEHLIVPFVLLIILLRFNDVWAGILFHTSILLFCFGFVGFVVIKARRVEEWFRVSIISAFTYFFVFLYPMIVVSLQYYWRFNGIMIIAGTNLIFIALLIIHFTRRRNLLFFKNQPCSIRYRH